MQFLLTKTLKLIFYVKNIKNPKHDPKLEAFNDVVKIIKNFSDSHAAVTVFY